MVTTLNGELKGEGNWLAIVVRADEFLDRVRRRLGAPTKRYFARRDVRKAPGLLGNSDLSGAKAHFFRSADVFFLNGDGHLPILRAIRRSASLIAVVLSLLFASGALAYTGPVNGVYTTDGSRADVQAAITAAVDGEIIDVPAGSFTWTSQVLIAGKGIHLRGAGSGKIIARSPTANTIAESGSKTWTVEAGLTLTDGQTIIAHVLYNGGKHMIGTVSSYSGTTLILNITSGNGTGESHALWCFRTTTTTRIAHAAGAGATCLRIDQDTDHIGELTGIHFADDNANVGGQHVRVIHGGTGIAGGQPLWIHDCQFSTAGSIGVSVRFDTNRGGIYNCSFDCGLYSGNGNGIGSDDQGIQLQSGANLADSWLQVSTMGSADTTGLRNFYIEDNRFVGMYLQAIDCSDNSRAVIRRNIFDNSAISSHGQVTGDYSMRHVELYDNTFHFDVTGAAGITTYAMAYLFYLRGGTGVITDNVMPDLFSQQWGEKAELLFTCYNLTQAGSAAPCQTTYPASRQPGRGYVDGTGPYNPDPYNSFKGDLEPIYVWGNTGGLNQSPSFNDSVDTCGNGLQSISFILEDRDYYIGDAKPGWAKYTYPHPLRPSGSEPPAGGAVRKLLKRI